MSMDSLINIRIHKFNVSVEKTAHGKFRWRAQTSADTLDELEANIQEIKERVEKRVIQWENEAQK
jgi:hypothetical protein